MTTPHPAEAEELARIERLSAELEAAEEADRAAQEAADQVAADREQAALRASSVRDGRDYEMELMVADVPEGVARVWADLAAADARAEKAAASEPATRGPKASGDREAGALARIRAAQDREWEAGREDFSR